MRASPGNVGIVISLSCPPSLEPLAAYTVNMFVFLFLRAHRETVSFFTASGYQYAQPDQDLFRSRRKIFFSCLERKVGIPIANASAFRVNFIVDGCLISSHSHTFPSHSRTSRLLSTSLSLHITFLRWASSYSSSRSSPLIAPTSFPHNCTLSLRFLCYNQINKITPHKVKLGC